MVNLNSFKDFFEVIGVKLLAVIVVLLIGVVLARIISKLLAKILKEIELDSTLRKEVKLKMNLEKFISGIVIYVVYIIIGIIALGQLGITTSGFYIISAILVGMIIIFLGLATKDFIPSITAGYLLKKKGILKIGDVINLKGVKGEIIKIGLIETEIKTKKDERIMVPNSVLRKEIGKKGD